MINYNLKILVIEDEQLIRWSLRKQLEKDGYDVYEADTGERGLELYAEVSPDVVLLDHNLPGAKGLEILRTMRNRNRSSSIIFITAYGSIDVAVEAMREGAIDYMSKPVEYIKIQNLISRIGKMKSLEMEVSQIRERNKAEHGVAKLIGISPHIKETVQLVKKISDSGANTILIEGDSGTGKEVVARAIHYESKASNKPFITINCAALPETLLESELFGHEKGAFTDAKSLKQGQLELAGKGTIFLDEIGEISLGVQVKLLRVFESRSFKRVGGTKDITIHSRIITATNRNLTKAIEEEKFRQDLYYRLKVIQIGLHPLRKRREDIPILLQYFIEQFNLEFGKNVKNISDDAMRILTRYSWPGNVREVRNVIERVLILEDIETIESWHLPPEIVGAETHDSEGLIPDIPLENFRYSLEMMEKMMVQKALLQTKGNQSKAAKLLSVSRDTLRYKMKKHSLLSSN